MVLKRIALLFWLILSMPAWAGEDVVAKGSIDRRVEIDRTSEEFKQLNAIGLVTHTHQKFIGTGFLVSPCAVLTNNHVAFGDKDKETPQKGKGVYFSVGQTGNIQIPFKHQLVKGEVVDFGDYDNSFSGTNYDWALIKVNKVRNNNGEYANLGDMVGYIQILQLESERMLRLKKIETTGFPGDKSSPSNFSKMYGDLGCKITQIDTYFGSDINNCQTTNGQSGSPLLAKTKTGVYYAVGMVSGGVKDGEYFGLDDRGKDKFSLTFSEETNHFGYSSGNEIVKSIKSIRCD